MLEKAKAAQQLSGKYAPNPATEILNPLNTLSTSLQNLADEHPDIDDSKYLKARNVALTGLAPLFQNLADAANLEEALEAEELEKYRSQRASSQLCCELRVIPCGGFFSVQRQSSASALLGIRFSNRTNARQAHRQCRGFSPLWYTNAHTTKVLR